MPKFLPIDEVIDLALLANQEYGAKPSKMRMLKWAKYVYMDLNLDAMRVAVRKEYVINKRTNTVDLDDDCLAFSSVSIIDSSGVIHPVYRNDRLHRDIVEVPAEKNCACEFKCGYQLCNMMKAYEAVVSTKTDTNPDGSTASFNCVDRITVDKNGFVYKELQYPKRIYTNGVWTSTILYTEQIKMCVCEVDKNGCLCDTKSNLDAICTACNIGPIGNDNPIPIGGTAQIPPNPSISTWIYHCNRKLDFFAVQCGCHSWGGSFSNIYNISEDQKRLIFPYNFGFDRVLVRWYKDASPSGMQIPLTCVDTFVTGLIYWDLKWDKKMQRLAMEFNSKYANQKTALFEMQNRFRIAEMRMILTPPVYVPSYIDRKWKGDGFGYSAGCEY